MNFVIVKTVRKKQKKLLDYDIFKIFIILKSLEEENFFVSNKKHIIFYKYLKFLFNFT